MKMKLEKILRLIAMVSVLGMLCSQASAQFSANVAIQSDYAWRGYSQNMEDPSIQGGFDYADESGFYVGIWGASVDFGGPESTEGDIYLGFANELDNGIGFDVGIIEYTYHGSSGASDANFTEFYIGLSFEGLALTYSFGDEFGDNVELSYGYDFDQGFSIGAAVGDYEDSWTYWTIGISGEVEGIGWDISLWDTDLDGDPLGDTRVVFTISADI